MSEADFILQYVAAKTASLAKDYRMNFNKESLNAEVERIIKEATWVWMEIPKKLKSAKDNGTATSEATE